MSAPTRIRPRPLPSGGTVGVCAPASPFHNRSDVLRGVAWWERQGYHVQLADGLEARDGYLAGPPEQRAADLMRLVTDPQVDAIQTLHGGFGCAQLIEHLDFELIRAHPKPIVGSSDVSTLHAAIGQATGLVTFYGPGLTKLARPTTPQFNRDHLLRALTATEPLGEIPRNPSDGYVRTIVGGQAEGELVGGALWVLSMTIGTPWQLDLDGRILLLEEIGESPWRMDALLTHMAQAGVLDGVRGIVVSELVDCDWSEHRPEYPQTLSIDDVLERHLERLGVPALHGLPLGHGEHAFTTPLRVRVALDADQGSVSFLDAATLE